MVFLCIESAARQQTFGLSSLATKAQIDFHRGHSARLLHHAPGPTTRVVGCYVLDAGCVRLYCVLRVVMVTRNAISVGAASYVPRSTFGS